VPRPASASATVRPRPFAATSSVALAYRTKKCTQKCLAGGRSTVRKGPEVASTKATRASVTGVLHVHASSDGLYFMHARETDVPHFCGPPARRQASLIFAGRMSSSGAHVSKRRACLQAARTPLICGAHAPKQRAESRVAAHSSHLRGACIQAARRKPNRRVDPTPHVHYLRAVFRPSNTYARRHCTCAPHQQVWPPFFAAHHLPE